MRRLGLLAAIGLLACNEHGTAGSDADKCGGLGCASGPGTLTLTLIDSTTKLAVKGTIDFRDVNGKLPFACSASVGPTMACPSWKLSMIGGFDVMVTAPTYRTGMIHVQIDGPAGCCGIGPDTAASLELVPM